MKKFLNEFKEFAIKGNVMNLAVGVIIGSAFQGVVSSLTENILSPVIGLVARQNFDTLSATFFGVTLHYGAFITSVINFFIMAFVVFLLVKVMNRILEAGKPKAETPVPAAPTTKPCPFCQSEIPLKATRCPCCTSHLE